LIWKSVQARGKGKFLSTERGKKALIQKVYCGRTPGTTRREEKGGRESGRKPGGETFF